MSATDEQVAETIPAEKDGTRASSAAVAAGGILGALAASACCILPLALFGMGVSGAWISNLTAMYPYKPYFLLATAIFIGWGFYLTRAPARGACKDGAVCARPLPGRLVRASLWLALLLALAAFAFPWVAPWFLGDLN